MQSKKQQALFALATVLVYLLFGALGQSGIVLCLEEDGRLKLEASRLDGSCCDEENRNMDTPPVAEGLTIVRGPETACGDCIDLSLSEDGVQSIQHSSNTHLTRLLLPLLVIPLPSSARSIYATRAAPSDSPSYLQSSSLPISGPSVLLI